MINDIDLDKYYAKPNKTIQQHIDDMISVLNQLRDLGYIENNEVYEFTVYAIKYHDIGKINREFQKRVTSILKKIPFDSQKEIYHNILSICFFDAEWYEDEKRLSVVNAVLNHHNYCDPYTILTRDEDSSLIDSLLVEFGIKKPKRKLIRKVNDDTVINSDMSILIKGLLHKCDYSASAGYTAEYRNDFLLTYLNSINYKWNDMQNFCKDNTNENIIVVAQTGMGKTEAGLLWIGDNKGFFILPIRTAINAMYDRVKINILHNQNINQRLAILHSESFQYYLNNQPNDTSIDETMSDILEYESRGKALSMPLSISTLDQLFDFVFRYNGYELKLATLSYSKIVIDEIQMYGPELLSYLIYGIKRITDLGGKVAILTATFPQFISDLMQKQGIKFESRIFYNELIRHNIQCYNRMINAQDIYDKYMENHKKGKSNKILVVCNTVYKAQQIYSDLKQLGIDKNLDIIHAKFIRKQRNKKEKEILECGRTYEYDDILDKRECIWVTTSIVEASLDIDFDYIFTELQDLCSLLQRLGRCNRKGAKDCTQTNCFIYTQIDSSLFINREWGFIDKKIFELSKQAIEGNNGLLSENEKINLINTYLTLDNLKDSDYLMKYNEAIEYLDNLRTYSEDKSNVRFRDILSETVIPKCIYNDNKNEIDNYIQNYQNCTNRAVRESLKSRIYDYTLSVPKDYLVKNNTVKIIKLRHGEDIRVVECDYDDMGFRW